MSNHYTEGFPPSSSSALPNGVSSPDDGAAAVVVVEVGCDAPRRDWPELASVLRSYLRQVTLVAQAQRVAFPFRAGALMTWEGAMASTGLDSASSESDYSFPTPPALLQQTISSFRICDLTDPSLLAYSTSPPRRPPPSATTTAASVVPGTTTASAAADFGDNERFSLHRQQQQQQQQQQHYRDIVFAPVLLALQREPAWEDYGADGGAADDMDSLPSCTILALPHASLDGLWESLSYGESPQDSIAMKRDLIEYVRTAMLFSAARVDVHCITWNRMVLLHGPPGTGKTSLCKALAHKLATRLCGGDPSSSSSLFSAAKLVEVNAHSLFSRWFSESGKQVMQLFVRIRAIAADPTCLVCVLVDEVESLAAARQAAMKGNEPSDSIRVVNALLTQLDSLQHLPNVLVLATSNMTGAIDVAYLDRADKKVYVGPPGLAARHAMLHAAVMELLGKGLLHFSSSSSATTAAAVCGQPRSHQDRHRRDEDEEDGDGGGGDCFDEAVRALETIAAECAGFNGRLLKKLPFLAYGACQAMLPPSSSSLSFSASLLSSSSSPVLHPNSVPVPPVFMSQQQQQKQVPGGGGVGSPPTPRMLKPEYIGGSSSGGGGGGGLRAPQPSTAAVRPPAPLPSVPTNVYLHQLREAVRREIATKASMAATTQHLEG